MTRLLRLLGHDVAVAADAPTALSLAKSFQPEFAILDISLHGITGFDLAHRLREASPSGRPYLIALTAFAGAGMRDACLAAGFDAYLVKPKDIPKLQALLAQ